MHAYNLEQYKATRAVLYSVYIKVRTDRKTKSKLFSIKSLQKRHESSTRVMHRARTLRTQIPSMYARMERALYWLTKGLQRGLNSSFVFVRPTWPKEGSLFFFSLSSLGLHTRAKLIWDSSAAQSIESTSRRICSTYFDLSSFSIGAQQSSAAFFRCSAAKVEENLMVLRRKG